MMNLPEQLPESGIGETELLNEFRLLIGNASAPLGEPTSFAHMDPPPPEVAVEVTRLNAMMNQNLLHPSLSPFATVSEDKVIKWLAPFFGMGGGHMCGGSTLANLTALWSAREHGAKTVVASKDAHMSVKKSAAILAMPFEVVPVDAAGRMNVSSLPDLNSAALVLTAGTTGSGAIDPLTNDAFKTAVWLHVDAAWAGPLRLTKYADRLAGIEQADSVAISAHKWFFQPKDSAIILFADPAHQDPISFGGSYLARPNVGVQGSRGAVGVTLLATLIAWGREGLAQRIEKCMSDAAELAKRLDNDPRTKIRGLPETGVLNWRPVETDPKQILPLLEHVCSSVEVDDRLWIRNVAANPSANIDLVWGSIDRAFSVK